VTKEENERGGNGERKWNERRRSCNIREEE
jgi:hypothetical protein